MSILIKGMEMPKNCLECTFYRKTDPIYDYCCISSAVPKGYVPEDCPLIPVPDHGRLIDANALEEKTDDRYSLGEIGRRERDDIVDALRYCAPTIIPADKESRK